MCACRRVTRRSSSSPSSCDDEELHRTIISTSTCQKRAAWRGGVAHYWYVNEGLVLIARLNRHCSSKALRNGSMSQSPHLPLAALTPLLTASIKSCTNLNTRFLFLCLHAVCSIVCSLHDAYRVDASGTTLPQPSEPCRVRATLIGPATCSCAPRAGSTTGRTHTQTGVLRVLK